MAAAGAASEGAGSSQAGLLTHSSTPSGAPVYSTPSSH